MSSLEYYAPIDDDIIITASDFSPLRHLILHGDSYYWNSGCGQGWLQHDGPDGSHTELLLTFEESVGFSLEYIDIHKNHFSSLGEGDFEHAVIVYVGGNPVYVPTACFIPREAAWEAVQEFCRTGQPSPAVQWVRCGDLKCSHRDCMLTRAGELGLAHAEFRAVPDAEARAVASAVQERFGSAVKLLWWHPDAPCALPQRRHEFPGGPDPGRLTALVPDPTEVVWLVAEDLGDGDPPWLLFEGRPDAIRRLLGHYFRLDYFVVSRQLEWLVGENRHGGVFAVGQPAVECLDRLLAP